MTLEESTDLIRDLSLEDIDAAAARISERARAVVEFAAQADLDALHNARSAGQALVQQLLDERRRTLAELQKARAFHESLLLNRSFDGEACRLIA